MRTIRYISDPQQLAEITCRVSQGRFLFLPRREFNRRFLGVLGRAQQETGMKIFGYAVLSGHYHLLIQPGEAGKQADFMRYLNTNLSKEVGRLYKFYGPKFQRRYTSIPISNETTVQIDRLRYILSNSAKEGLVTSPLDWPGVHCARALIDGTSDSGTWYDRTKQRIAKNQQRKPKREEIATDYEVKLSPLPCWAHLSQKEYRARIADMVKDIEVETKAMHREKGTRPLGVRKILKMSPFDTPEKISWSNAPPINVRSQEIKKYYFEAYHTFLSAYRKAAEALKKGALHVRCRGRDPGCPGPPAQIPASRFPALGSCLR